MTKKTARRRRARRVSSELVRPESRITVRVPGDGGGALAFLRAMGFGSGAGGWLPFVGGNALRDTEQLDDPYLRETRVAAAINLKARTVSSVRLRLWDKDPDDPGANEVTGGPLFTLLQRMGPGLNPSLVEMIDSLNIDLAGDSIWFLRDKAGQPVAAVGAGADALIELPADIVPVRGDRVSLELDPGTGMPRVWRVQVSGSNAPREWAPAAVEPVWDLPHREFQPWRGQSLVELLYGSAAQNFLARRYQSFILKNDGAPAGIVSVETWPTVDQAKLLRAELDDNWNNPANAGKHKLLMGGATYAGTRVAPKDLEYGGVLKANQADESEVLGTPAALLGEHQENYATFAGHMLVYIEQRIVPYLRAKAARINRLIGRLRDPALRGLRAGYDIDAVMARFRDVKALGDQVTAMVAAGVPLNQALLMVGLKVDPLDGGDEAMVPTGREPLRLSILKSQATTAIQLQQAGVDGARSFQLVGLEADFVELEEPEPEAPPPAGGKTDDVKKPPTEEGKGLPVAGVGSEQVATSTGSPRATGDGPLGRCYPFFGGEKGVEVPDRAGQAERRAASAASRIQAWRHVQKLQLETRTTLNGRVKKVFYDIRRAQMHLLEHFAETGKIDRDASLVGTPAGGAAPPAAALAVYRGAPPTVPAAALRGLWKAWRADVAEERELAAKGDARLTETVVVDCTGTTETRRRSWRRQQEGWARRYPAFARAGLLRCRDLAVLQRVQITEAEIDQLILAADGRWIEALAEKMRPLLEKAHRIGGRDIAAEIGITFPDTVDPDVLRRIAARAIKVSEGSLSVVAQRLRSDLIATIAETGSTGTLQSIIASSLTELKATVSQVFNSTAARAGLIARQEVGTAVAQVRHEEMESAEAAGVVQSREWVTSGRGPESAGGTVRESHFAMEGQLRDPGQPFTSGLGNQLDHPLDPDAPAEDIIGCQCVERAIVKDDED